MWVMLATPEELSNLSEAQLRELAASLITELRHKQTLITQLTHEMAILKRLKFAAKAERFNAQQRSLLDEDTDADLQGLSDEIDAHSGDRDRLNRDRDRGSPLGWVARFSV